MVASALFAALMAICAWISIPVGDTAFTMQTFAVFLALGVLGGKWGCTAILVYLLLGAVGLPVFSAFRGGLGALAGPTGGYIWGFAAAGLVYWALEKLCKPIGILIAMLACYGCGCLWFMYYAGGTVGFVAAMAKCVLPYLIPDAVKLYLAYTLSGRIRKHIK